VGRYRGFACVPFKLWQITTHRFSGVCELLWPPRGLMLLIRRGSWRRRSVAVGLCRQTMAARSCSTDLMRLTHQIVCSGRTRVINAAQSLSAIPSLPMRHSYANTPGWTTCRSSVLTCTHQFHIGPRLQAGPQCWCTWQIGCPPQRGKIQTPITSKS